MCFLRICFGAFFHVGHKEMEIKGNRKHDGSGGGGGHQLSMTYTTNTKKEHRTKQDGFIQSLLSFIN